MLELDFLLIFMIVGALIALEVKDLLSGVVAVGASGLALCIAFLILKAPDLAITQLVVEILCLVILIRATIKVDLPFSTSGRWLFNTFATFIFLGFFIYFSYIAFKDLPVFGQPYMKASQFFLDNAKEATGAVNLVSSVVLNFRVYDTLGEATVLFASVIGVLAVMRKVGRKDVSRGEIEDEL